MGRSADERSRIQPDSQRIGTGDEEPPSASWGQILPNFMGFDRKTHKCHDRKIHTLTMAHMRLSGRCIVSGGPEVLTGDREVFRNRLLTGSGLDTEPGGVSGRGARETLTVSMSRRGKDSSGCKADSPPPLIRTFFVLNPLVVDAVYSEVITDQIFGMRLRRQASRG